MYPLKIGFITLGLVLNNHILFSSNIDSSGISRDSSRVRFFSERDFTSNMIYYSQIDTSLNQFEIYKFHNGLGNIGLPVNVLSLSQLQAGNDGNLVEKSGFNYKNVNSDSYLFSRNSVKYYDAKSPFTQFLTVFGAKKEQVFKLTHSQNINKNLNLAFSFQRIRSDGFYKRQSITQNNIYFSSNYNSKDNRYHLLSNAIYNNSKVAENGGIQNDSLFENQGSIDRQLMEINLLSAQRRVKNRSFLLKQYYNTGYKTERLKDSSVTGDPVLVSTFHSTNCFSHSFNIQSDSSIYEDNAPNSGFYKHVYNDTNKTSDPTSYFKMENVFSWETLENKKNEKKRNIGLALHAEHQLFHIKQHAIDSTFKNFILRGDVFNFYSSKVTLLWKGSGIYVFNESNKGDYNASICIKKGLDANMINHFGLEGTMSERRPDFIFQRYSSNNFRWGNNFDKVNIKFARLYYSGAKRFSISISACNISNYIYFNSFALPEQLRSSALNVFSAQLIKDFHSRGSGFNLNNKIIYQYIPASSPIKLPSIVLDNCFYYENTFFNKALRGQFGFDVFYNSAYFANAYMPATGQFYIQDEKKIGNYIYVDFFANLKIKAVRLFFKMEHVNAGISGYNYYMVPHYPTPDRAFRFGLSWTFLD